MGHLSVAQIVLLLEIYRNTITLGFSKSDLTTLVKLDLVTISGNVRNPRNKETKNVQ